jgi:hypothetical protein
VPVEREITTAAPPNADEQIQRNTPLLSDAD